MIEYIVITCILLYCVMCLDEHYPPGKRPFADRIVLACIAAYAMWKLAVIIVYVLLLALC